MPVFFKLGWVSGYVMVPVPFNTLIVAFRKWMYDGHPHFPGT
jgi:hypothetical protein